jgi:bifunctional non-homologous end joining protein LigD
MTNLSELLSEEDREKVKNKDMPKKITPMLAKLSHEVFSDRDWIFERKLDGERCLAFCHGRNVTLKSRNGKELNVAYPELADAVSRQKVGNFILDGEIVAFSGHVTSFSRLQKRMQLQDREKALKSGVAVYYYIFDLLYADTFDLSDLPLRSRKSVLKKIISFADPIRFTVHHNREGKKFYQRACKKGWEGLIAKRADSTYVHGRSANWLKFKCVNQQELVVGGYTEPHGTREGFGALLLGYYQKGKLVYAGKVGTGFDEETLDKLSDKLENLHRKTSPFDNKNISEEDVHWTSPKLVAEIGFTEWTSDGKLRHPRYLGLRRDKDPEEVEKEQ